MLLKKNFPIIALLLVVLVVSCKKEEDKGLRPSVTSTSPLNNAIKISLDGKISATFSMAMNPSSISTLSFTLQQGAVYISGATSYVDTTATFTPSASLSPNTLYKATITSVVKNISGKTLLNDYV